MSDDDLLLERLRQRAYDPAWRFDQVPVPHDWVEQRYSGQVVTDYLCGRQRFPAGAPQAVAFYSHSPRRLPYPPASPAQVSEAEQIIGHRIPDLLRRLYTEVANGGFGPHEGFASITDGFRDPWYDGRSAVATYLSHQSEGLPPWFPLAGAGCSMYWYTALTEPGNPVHLYDWDGWDFPERQPADVGIVHTTPTLSQWL